MSRFYKLLCKEISKKIQDRFGDELVKVNDEEKKAAIHQVFEDAFVEALWKYSLGNQVKYGDTSKEAKGMAGQNGRF